MILTNQPLPPFDEALYLDEADRAQPLHVRGTDDFIVLTQWDGTDENTHCILVERADIPALIQALERMK